jgi:hypothetical protein
LHAILRGQHEGEVDPHLRLTIHVPKDEYTVQQLIEYVGDDRTKNAAGRIFPAHAGVIGEVLREKDRIVARRKTCDYDQYVKELTTIWRYTKERAKDANPATMSWMGIPIVDQRDGIVAGILYLDSTFADFFDENKQQIAAQACDGIVRYLYDRYRLKREN